MTSRFQHLRVRVNVTWDGILLDLNEYNAVVQVPRAQPPERQTTLSIRCEVVETLYLPARVVLSVPQSGPAGTEHRLVMELLQASGATMAALRDLIDEPVTAIQRVA